MKKLKSQDLTSLRGIVKKRLFNIPPEIKKFFPPILSKQFTLNAFLTDTYLLLSLVDEEGLIRINEFLEKNYHPFPCLVADKDGSRPVLFRLNARNTYLNSIEINNMYAISLGKDTTAILRDIKQSAKTKEEGVLEYTIELAYIISFGDEINKNNMYDFLDDLVAYSVKLWRSGDE